MKKDFFCQSQYWQICKDKFIITRHLYGITINKEVLNQTNTEILLDITVKFQFTRVLVWHWLRFTVTRIIFLKKLKFSSIKNYTCHNTKYYFFSARLFWQTVVLSGSIALLRCICLIQTLFSPFTDKKNKKIAHK